MNYNKQQQIKTGLKLLCASLVFSIIFPAFTDPSGLTYIQEVLASFCCFIALSLVIAAGSKLYHAIDNMFD